MATSAPIKPAFRPFVPANESRPELTVRALLLGAVFGVLFGAVTVYVGLRAGLTVAASIPISVLSISILRAFGKASILENNIVQTTGNAGQSIASGVIFTLPALIFLGFDLESSRIFALALFGGWLGVLFMIPLRRQLIVDEHETLIYPEGTACADVLMAGERGGSFASRVFLGLGLGALYTLFQNEDLFALWPGTPKKDFNIGPQHLLKGGSIRSDCTAEYLGVGYIIGVRTAAVMLAGGVFSWLVLMPAIYFFGSHLSAPLYPGTVPVGDMSPSDLWRTYVRPMGAGAVAAAGLITLLRTLPTIVGALTQGFRKSGSKLNAAAPSRIEHDLPPSVVFGGSGLLVVLMFLFLQLKPVPGAYVGPLANAAAALLIVVFGFLFVTVSARIVGIVGSSASPVSGMTIATLMATTAIFLVKGWTAPAFGALAITIGGVVCIAASNAGDTSQDLKTGYLIGATPWKQQLALMIGVIVCIFSIGATLNAMNLGLEQFQRMPKAVPISLSQLPGGVQSKGYFARDRIALTSNNTANHHRHRQIMLNARRLLRCRRLVFPHLRKALRQRADNGWRRTQQRNQPAGRDRSRTHRPHIRPPQRTRVHLADRHGPRIQRPTQMLAKEHNRRHQHQPAKHTARQHDRRDAYPDNVPNAHILRRHIGAYRRALQNLLPIGIEVRLPVRRSRKQLRQILILKQRIQPADAQPQEHAARKRPTAFARLQHIRTGRSLGIDQRLVLFHNQLPPQRNHEQHAQPAAKQRQRKDPKSL